MISRTIMKVDLPGEGGASLNPKPPKTGLDLDTLWCNIYGKVNLSQRKYGTTVADILLLMLVIWLLHWSLVSVHSESLTSKKHVDGSQRKDRRLYLHISSNLVVWLYWRKSVTLTAKQPAFSEEEVSNSRLYASLMTDYSAIDKYFNLRQTKSVIYSMWLSLLKRSLQKCYKNILVHDLEYLFKKITRLLRCTFYFKLKYMNIADYTCEKNSFTEKVSKNKMRRYLLPSAGYVMHIQNKLKVWFFKRFGSQSFLFDYAQCNFNCLMLLYFDC